MKVLGYVFLVCGLGFLLTGFIMPMAAERSDVESAEFQQIRESASYLGIGLMIGAAACGALDGGRRPGGPLGGPPHPAPGTQGGAPYQPPQAPPPHQAPPGPQPPHGGWPR